MASTTSLWRALWARHAWLAAYFTFDPVARKLIRRYLPPAEANRASQQYRHYRRQFPEAVLLVIILFWIPQQQTLAPVSLGSKLAVRK